MKKVFKHLLLVTMLLSAALTATAQNIKVSGVVVDVDNVPVPGVYVVEKGTNNGTMADIQGQFSISVPKGAILELSSIGYTTKEVAATPQMKVVLANDNLLLDEIVVVGYGVQRVATVTGSVSQVSSEKLNVVPVGNTTHTLAGQLPGLVSTQTSGLPGQDNASLSIRGFGAPLVIVDGIEGSIEGLDPGQIESISILKDGSGSIYGARAGNGVILVTTKSGLNKEATISVNSSMTFQSNTVTTRPADSYQRSLYDNDVFVNGGGDPARKPYLDEELELFKSGINPEYRNVDWYGAVVRKYAPQQNHNVSIQGGTDKTKIYGYFGYNRQELQFKAKDGGYFDKYNFQVNATTKVGSNLNVGMNLQYTKTDKRYSSGGDLFQDGVNFWRSCIYAGDPRYPTSLPDKTLLSYANMQNGSPIWAVDINNSGYYQQLVNNMKFTGFAEYSSRFVQGLKAKANIMYTYGSSYLKWMHKRGDFYTYDSGSNSYIFNGGSVSPSYLRNDFSFSTNIVQQYSLNYNREFNGHNITGLVMFESTLNHYRNFYTKSENFETTIIEELFAADPETAINSSASSNYGRNSFIGRLNYNYQDKYLVEATVRGDASSRFAKGYRWGWFPSVSAGWNIAREDFMRSLGFIDSMKIRASYGQSGLDSVANFNYLTGYFFDLPYTLGDTAYKGLASTGMPNIQLTWETVAIANFGVDFSFFNRKLYGEVDVFQRDRSGIPAYRLASLPDTFGEKLPQENLNAIRGRGFEFKLGTSGQAGDFVYDMSANISWNRSKWTKYEQAEETDPDRIRLYKAVGNWTDRQIGYLADGLFTSQEEIDNWGVTVDQLNNDNSKFRPGDVKLVDLNGDGVINWRDQTVIGKGSTPHWMAGANFNFAWKGFDMSLLFQGAWGNTMSIWYESNTATYCELYYDQVHNPDPNARVARPNGADTNSWGSNFNNIDVAYLRLKNASIGYSLPKRFLDKIGVEKCRIYIGGMNLLTLSTVSKYLVDPESSGAVGNAYPQQYTLSFGVNVVL